MLDNEIFPLATHVGLIHFKRKSQHSSFSFVWIQEWPLEVDQQQKLLCWSFHGISSSIFVAVHGHIKDGIGRSLARIDTFICMDFRTIHEKLSGFSCILETSVGSHRGYSLPVPLHVGKSEPSMDGASPCTDDDKFFPRRSSVMANELSAKVNC